MKKKLNKVKLPSKPSELINLALKDLKAVEKSRQYVVNMNHWHETDRQYDNSIPEGTCAVCFAGSVMAQTCKAPANKSFGVKNFGRENTDKFIALDEFREGNIEMGFETLGLNFPSLLQSDIEIVDYQDDPKFFKEQMQEVADTLAKLGY